MSDIFQTNHGTITLKKAFEHGVSLYQNKKSMKQGKSSNRF
ncbi:hypothetical protein [Candidatus Enterovibrio altilux]|nr:hypothetical protein [Candidatus Enterovibrio luxaltus]